MIRFDDGYECDDSLSVGARIGIAIGIIVAVLLLAALAFYTRRRRLQRNIVYVSNLGPGSAYPPQPAYQPTYGQGPYGPGQPSQGYNYAYPPATGQTGYQSEVCNMNHSWR